MPRPVTGLAVADAWSRLLAYLLVAAVVGATVMMPIAGLALALTGAAALWSAEVFSPGPGPAQGPGQGPGSTGGVPARPPAIRSLRVLVRAVPTLPYAAAVCVVVTLVPVSIAAVGPVVDPLAACSWGAGAAAYVLWAGPGVRSPRRRLARLAGTVTSSQRLLGTAGAALGALAVLAMVGAISLKPSYAPMYALQNSLETTLGHLQSTLAHR